MSATKKPTVSPTYVEFSYPKLDIVRLMMESCQNMVKLAVTQTGEIAVNEYAMDSDTPTESMKKMMINHSIADIVNIVHTVTDSNFSTNFKDYDTLNTNIVIPIRYTATINDGLITALDEAIKNAIVYGSLSQWFTNVNAEALKAQSIAMFDMSKQEIVKNLKEIKRKLTFADIASYS